jgi:chromosome segregation ATPase
METPAPPTRAVPFFGARKMARKLLLEIEELRIARNTAEQQVERLAEIARKIVADAKVIQAEHRRTQKRLDEIGGLSIIEIDARTAQAEAELNRLQDEVTRVTAEIATAEALIKARTEEARQIVVETRETAILQEVGIYEYSHPLTDAVAYEQALDRLQGSIKTAAKKDGGAI